MKKSALLLLAALLSFNSRAQEKPVFVFDLVDGSLDSIPILAYDSARSADHTNYFTGNFNSATEILEQIPPVVNTYPGSNFTYKKRASLDLDVNSYPVRTSVKLFSVQNDTLSSLCSGSLISRRHVLTAAHCVSTINSNVLSHDSIQVSPVFDNGTFSSHFNSSFVSKIYFFKDWSFYGDDIAVLELEKPIGESTGWISIGYNKSDSLLSEGIFYKFSYPAITMPQVDTNQYNGDTLYYNYGEINLLSSTFLRISNASGIPGESGSSLIKVVNGKEYTTYGVLSSSIHLNHSRLSNWQFYTFKSIIEDDLKFSTRPTRIDNSLTVYPNPVNTTLFINSSGKNEVRKVALYNNLGEAVLNIDAEELSAGINISSLPNGVYYVRISADSGVETKRVIKK